MDGAGLTIHRPKSRSRVSACVKLGLGNKSTLRVWIKIVYFLDVVCEVTAGFFS